MTEKNNPDSGQNSLFSDQDLLFANEPLHSGAAVSITERAEALAALLAMLNQDSSVYGLSKAAESDPTRQDVLNRYGQATDHVVAGAAAKAAERKKTEKFWFRQAFGSYALSRTGYDEAEISSETNHDYDKFLEEFGVGKADAKKRNRAAKTIETSSRRITSRN